MAGTVAEPLYQQHKDSSFQAYVYYAQTAAGADPSADDCKAFREQYGLTMPVLMAPYAQVRDALGLTDAVNDWTVVTGPGATLLYRKKYADQNAVADIVEAALGL